MNRASNVRPPKLAEVIQALKNELRESAKASSDKLFKVTDVTVEIGVSFTRSSKAGASLGVVFDITDVAAAQHKISIRLSPIQADEIRLLTIADKKGGLIQGHAQKGASRPKRYRK